MYKSTKTYGGEQGFSTCFRQHRADSHCAFLHGYALQFKIVFAADKLDERNWVQDFGGLKPVKEWLKSMFDHTLLVAEDDPEIETLKELAEKNLAQVRILPSVGCEAVSKVVYENILTWAITESEGRVWVESVEVREHEGNSAVFAPSFDQIQAAVNNWQEARKQQAEEAEEVEAEVVED